MSDNLAHSTAGKAFLAHWGLYVTEAALLGLFMISACTFTILINHPSSPAFRYIPNPFIRRALIGASMGITAIVLIYSKWGKQSGAHMNPSFTICFLRLGKMGRWDAVFYIIAQFIGGMAGMMLCKAVAKQWLMHQSVDNLVTKPGPCGVLPAWVAEFGISMILMGTILGLNRFPSLVRWTGVFAGGLIALYVICESPLSGMSMNPARTLGAGVNANVFTGVWIYFTAPIAGMLTAVEIYRIVFGGSVALCPKVTHGSKTPCIIKCNCLASTGIKVGSQ